jgi:hypothetical protein
MTTRNMLMTLTTAALIAGAAGCGTSSTPTASAPTSVAKTSPTVQPAPAADAHSACDQLAGTVDADKTCHVQATTPTYKLAFRFPVDYPDQQSLTDFLMQRRDEFVDWVTDAHPMEIPYELDIIGKAYHSGTLTTGTQSLVLTIGSDTGVHPVTTYKAFNYDVGKHAPITFDTLFKPGSAPLEVLNPIVQRELDKRGGGNPVFATDIGPDMYQNFAITDDAVVFFFNQDGLLPHTEGPLEVDVPRSELAPSLSAPTSLDQPPPCASGQVRVTAGQPQAAVTHRAVTLTFDLAQDAGSCTVTGYPGVDTGAGGPLLHADRSPRGYMGGLPEGVDVPPTITLSPSTPAHAVVESLAVDDGGNQCPSYSDLRVTPPDTTETSNVATTIDTCALTVHPVT